MAEYASGIGPEEPQRPDLESVREQEVDRPGRWRWNIKMLNDPAAREVKFSAPIWTYVHNLERLRPPRPLRDDTPDVPRLAPVEFNTYLTTARLIHARHETDGDIHLVIGDPNHADVTMVVELPSFKTGQRNGDVSRAHAAFVSAFGMPPRKPAWLPLRGTAYIQGVGFFDYPHAEGGASAGFELHPVLGFSTQRPTFLSEESDPVELAEDGMPVTA
jgi:hypothetical protein